MNHKPRLLAATLLLVAPLLLSGCGAVDFSPGSNANPSANPTQTTSTAVDTVVYIDGQKYKVATTTYVLTWGKKDGGFGVENHRVVSVISREGKVVFTRKVFDDSAWFAKIGNWTLKAPHFKTLSSLKKTITDAT
jgi:hypothetical protein